MSLTFKIGNMFAEPVEAIVNTVNCAGVMGKGVALEFKKRWPENFKEYKKLCDAKELSPGSLFVHNNHDLLSNDGPKYLVNFPTKKHWRSKSKIIYIEEGLDALIGAIEKYHITSIAMPALGCGNGGLNWDEVKNIIIAKLSGLEDTSIVVFEQNAKRERPEHESRRSLPMTFERAITLKALGDLEAYFDGAYDRVSMHKIVYFLQALGVDYQLDFDRNLYGPYSTALKKAFLAFEKLQLLKGFSNEDRMSKVTSSGYAASDEFLKSNDSSRAEEIVKNLDILIQGYESPYGLELLSSVHWLCKSEGKKTFEEVSTAFYNWNESKRVRFSKNDINAAFKRLQNDRLVPLNTT